MGTPTIYRGPHLVQQYQCVIDSIEIVQGDYDDNENKERNHTSIFIILQEKEEQKWIDYYCFASHKQLAKNNRTKNIYL